MHDPQTVEEMTPGVLRVAGWERYPWLRAGFSTRAGGGSQVYGEDELNLGWTTEDDALTVAANRRAFAQAVTGGLDLPLITVRQVHGTAVRVLDTEAEPWMQPDGRARLEGDGVLSRATGRLLASLTADCVPVLVADAHTHAVGALHAGWRGTVGGIAGRGVKVMVKQLGSRPQDLLCAIGPCIGPCCFEVGHEVRDAFLSRDESTAELFRAGREGRSFLDLVEANRRQLVAAGVPGENITSLGLCTSCARTGDGHRLFFSHRAEQGRTGRMLSGIAAVPGTA